MQNLTFRKAEKYDSKIILDIYNFYISTTTATFDYVEISETEFLQRIHPGSDKYPVYLVTTDTEELAGFCFLTRFREKPAYDRTAEIGIYLKPEFTGKGLGETIINFLEEEARKIDFKNIIASASGENTASIRLLRKMKYQQCTHYRQIAEKFGRILDIIDFQKILTE